MKNFENTNGKIHISSDVFSSVTGAVATECFGVKGMAMRSVTDGLVHLLKKESMSKGVHVIYNDDDTISVELHIIVDQGVNVVAISRSIMKEVKYMVGKLTGIEVKDVNIFVDMVAVG